MATKIINSGKFQKWKTQGKNPIPFITVQGSRYYLDQFTAYEKPLDFGNGAIFKLFYMPTHNIGLGLIAHHTDSTKVQWVIIKEVENDEFKNASLC